MSSKRHGSNAPESSSPSKKRARKAAKTDKYSLDELGYDSGDNEDYARGEEVEADSNEVAPVVFQCLFCSAILSDSYFYESSTPALQLISFTEATNVEIVQDDPHTSDDAHDLGATYQELICQNCNTVVGRKYLTTPNKLDSLRSRFSFLSTALASYTLGELAPNDVNAEATQQFVTDLSALNDNRPKIAKLEEQLAKFQDLMLVMEDRLYKLEQKTQVEELPSMKESVKKKESPKKAARNGVDVSKMPGWSSLRK